MDITTGKRLNQVKAVNLDEAIDIIKSHNPGPDTLLFLTEDSSLRNGIEPDHFLEYFKPESRQELESLALSDFKLRLPTGELDLDGLTICVAGSYSPTIDLPEVSNLRLDARYVRGDVEIYGKNFEGKTRIFLNNSIVDSIKFLPKRAPIELYLGMKDIEVRGDINMALLRGSLQKFPPQSKMTLDLQQSRVFGDLNISGHALSSSAPGRNELNIYLSLSRIDGDTNLYFSLLHNYTFVLNANSMSTRNFSVDLRRAKMPAGGEIHLCQSTIGGDLDVNLLGADIKEFITIFKSGTPLVAGEENYRVDDTSSLRIKQAR